MFWLLRFRGETIWDTFALWINAIVWQVRKTIYLLLHPHSQKKDFVEYIISQKIYQHWTTFPFDLRQRSYYDSTYRLWMDTIGITWLYFAHPEDYPEEWMQALRPGQIGLDIGAHRGYWSLFYQAKILPGGLIFALEPNPENYTHLLKNLARNQISHVIPLRLAAWSKSTVLSLEGSANIPINSFLSRVKPGTGGDTLAVSIDALTEALNLPQLDWIKIDIEGAEVEALKGAMKTLSRYRPTLWIEFHDTLEEVKVLLAEANYEIKGEVHYAPTPHHRDSGYLWAVPRTPHS